MLYSSRPTSRHSQPCQCGDIRRARGHAQSAHANDNLTPVRCMCDADSGRVVAGQAEEVAGIGERYGALAAAVSRPADRIKQLPTCTQRARNAMTAQSLQV